MFNRILTLVKKDILIEFRQKNTFYGILLYIASTIYVMYLSLQENPSAQIWNSLFWVIQLFICVNVVAKSFLAESKGRMLYFFSITSPTEYIISKLIFNIILMILMSLVSLCLFYLFLGKPVVQGGHFIEIVILGGSGISMVFTLMSALAAKAQQNAALIAILGFPVILPHLMLIMRLSKVAFAEVFREGAVFQLVGITLALDLLIVVLSIILFPYLWKD